MNRAPDQTRPLPLAQDEVAIARRVQEHLDAGADHVLVHPLAPDVPSVTRQLEGLAPALLSLV
jgi:hypothetical protein